MSPLHLGVPPRQGLCPRLGPGQAVGGLHQATSKQAQVQPAKRMPGASSRGDRTPLCQFPDCNDRCPQPVPSHEPHPGPATPQPSELTACAWHPRVLSWVGWEVEPPIQEEARMPDQATRSRNTAWEVCREHEPEKHSRFHGKILHQHENPGKEQM